MNPDVFEDTDFAPSYVTDRPMQTSSDDLTQIEQMSDESPPAVPNSNTNEKESNDNQTGEADEQHEEEKSNEEQDKTDTLQSSDPNEESNFQKYLQERQRVLDKVSIAHYSATVRETAAGHQDHQKKTAKSFDTSEERPFSKEPPLKNPRITSSRKRKTDILNDTPEKNAHEEEEKRKCQKQQ
ncbi:uncharacterized protein LOC134727721 [Mytilus trossulus]|uniref:uncharacterized protein LOC134727721 n=1 Tax=Mytilus trossulus TaxID=6551 RepID=UPI003006C917